MPALQYVRLDDSCPFGQSFRSLKDAVAKARIDSAVRKLGRGLMPDVRPVGDGVHEARIDYGPGYRVYFGNEGGELVVLLLCGDKRTQAGDIATAKVYWAEYGIRKNALVIVKEHPQPSPLLRAR